MIKYDDIVDYYKINTVYKKICQSTEHKRKLIYFELYKFSKFIYIYRVLNERIYTHGNYNVFMIKYPKHRIIMSENLIDKIVNHLVSTYALFPTIEPTLIEANVATRVGKGLDKGIELTKKYLNKMRDNLENVYVLKCDINKYFYNIDHEVLFQKLDKLEMDKEILDLIKGIVSSTNNDYVNQKIAKIVDTEIKNIKASNRNLRDKEILITKLSNIPKYMPGKGLPIGNMTSQILAIFYLNDLDHFIKEKLRIKYYVRYMDDFVLFHEDREYLKYCKGEIEKKLKDLKLVLNKKTQIAKLTTGFVFLGYRFLVKNKKVHMLASKSMKKKIKKRYKKEGKIILDRYNGYLKRCKSGRLVYSMKYYKKLNNKRKMLRNIEDIENTILEPTLNKNKTIKVKEEKREMEFKEVKQEEFSFDNF